MYLGRGNTVSSVTIIPITNATSMIFLLINRFAAVIVLGSCAAGFVLSPLPINIVPTKRLVDIHFFGKHMNYFITPICLIRKVAFLFFAIPFLI